MKIIKLILALLFCVVTVLYAGTALYRAVFHKNDPPVISCSSHTLEVKVTDGADVLLSGISASDPQDGDLTAQVRIAGTSKLIDQNTAKVTYLVFDSDNNMGSYTRFIRYTDYARPRFEVTSPLLFDANQEIAPAKFIRAVDTIDGDISSSVRIATLNLTTAAGVYTITATVTNRMGDTAQIALPVILVDGLSSRVQVQLKQYLLYLDHGAAFDPASYLKGVTDPGDKAPSLADVQITSEVDTTAPGTYRVTYTYGSGNQAGTAILTVVVQ